MNFVSKRAQSEPLKSLELLESLHLSQLEVSLGQVFLFPVTVRSLALPSKLEQQQICKITEVTELLSYILLIINLKHERTFLVNEAFSRRFSEEIPRKASMKTNTMTECASLIIDVDGIHEADLFREMEQNGTQYLY